MQLFHLSFSGFAGDRWAEICVSCVEWCVIGEGRREGGRAESESQNTVYEYVCVCEMFTTKLANEARPGSNSPCKCWSPTILTI